MRHSTQCTLAALLCIPAFLLNGCGGSSSSDDSQEIEVWPSLGQIRAPTVRITNPDDSPIESTATPNDDGSIVVSFSEDVTGPLVIEIRGNDNATYFDEASDSFQPFGNGERIRHVLASPTSPVGVTALTEFAALLLEAVPSPNASQISQANSLIRNALAPSMQSITIAPQNVAATGDLGRLEASEAGEYAAILAALALMHNNPSDPSPALEVVNQLGQDLLSGSIDGLDAQTRPIANLAYDAANFVNDFATAVNSVDDGSPLDGHDYQTVSLDIGYLGITLERFNWTAELIGTMPDVYTIFMVVDVSPLAENDIDSLGGILIWNETEVEFCNAEVRGTGSDFVRIGQGFETSEDPECGDASAIQDAFDNFGLPVNACVSVTTGGVDYSYCAPLELI